MSILIKCMEIPKSCGRCWFNNSSLSCAITGSCIDRDDENRERLDDCPLVDLGKHGDLIDAESLNIHDISPVNGFCVMGVTEEDIGLAKKVIEAEE